MWSVKALRPSYVSFYQFSPSEIRVVLIKCGKGKRWRCKSCELTSKRCLAIWTGPNARSPYVEIWLAYPKFQDCSRRTAHNADMVSPVGFELVIIDGFEWFKPVNLVIWWILLCVVDGCIWFCDVLILLLALPWAGRLLRSVTSARPFGCALA